MNMIRYTLPLKVFGIIGLIVITGSASSTDENLSTISQCTTPKNYNILLEIQNPHLIVVSNVDIDFTCTQQCIRLYISRNCDIQTIHVKLNGTTHFSSRDIDIILQNSTMTHRFKSVDIGFTKHNRTGLDERKITPGRYTIYSTYNCQLEKIATVSTYITKPKNQTEEKAFLMLPHIPAEWIFPYWENPAIKAIFTILIQTKFTETAVSNMIFTTMYPVKNISFTLFNTTPPISTHLVAAGVLSMSYNSSFTCYLSIKKISFTSRELARNSTLYAKSLINDINARIRTLRNDTIALSHNITYLAFPVNFTNYKTLVTKGLVIFSETDIIYDEKVDSIVKKREVTCSVARTVIQEIFSDRIATCKQSDVWYSEGFSTTYGVYIYDQLYNTNYSTPVMNLFVVQTRRQFFDYTEAFSKYNLQDTLFISRNSILSKLWQDKGFSTVYMLNKVFSKENVYKSMVKEVVHSDYYTTFKAINNAIFVVPVTVVTDSTSNDTYNEQSLIDKLWNSKFENLYWILSSYQKRVAKNIIKSWTAHVGYPVIQVKRRTDTQTLEIMVIDCFDVDQKELCDHKWWIPVVLHKITTTEANFTDLMYVLRPRQYSIDIQFSDENTSVILVNTTGYRVNYDRTSWKTIALFLKNADSKILKLSDVTLAQILDDAFYFLVQNTQYNENPDFDDVDIYFDLASSLFCVNKSYIAWYPFLNALENISKSFLFPQNVAFKHIKDRLLEMLNKFLDDIDDTYGIYSSKNYVNNQLYHEVLKWNCILGGSKCAEHINKKLQWHFKDTAQHKLLSSWQKWIYCQGLMLENVIYEKSVIWQTLINMYTIQSKESELPELINFLSTCSKVPENILDSVHWLSYPLPVYEVNRNATKPVIVTFLFNIFAKHSKNIESLSSILKAIGLIKRNLNIVATVSCIINNINSNESLSKITDENFLQQLTNIHNTPLFVLDAIKEKVEHRRRS